MHTVSCPIGPMSSLPLASKLHRVSIPSYLMTSKENLASGIHQVASKIPRKIQNIEILNKLSIYESHHYFITQQKEVQIYQFLPIFTNHTRNLQLFQFHSSVVVGLPHQKLGVLILQNRPRPSPSSVHSSRRSPELHFPEW